MVQKNLDTGGDGQVSFDEFEKWLKSASNDDCKKSSAAVTKAKAILAPADGDGLEAVFYAYCTAGRCEMESKSFLKMYKDAGLISKSFTSIQLDIIYNHTSVKPKGNKFIDLHSFEVAMEIAAEKLGEDRSVLRAKFLELSTATLVGTKADYVRFHDDKSTYTGAHRFDHTDMPGGGSVGTQVHELHATSSSSLGKDKPGSPKLKRASSSCTSLRDPKRVPENKELYKVFGLSTKVGRQLRVIFNKPGDLVTQTKPASPKMSRTTSLPPINGMPQMEYGDYYGQYTMWCPQKNTQTYWKSPYTQYLEENRAEREETANIVMRL